MNDDLERLGRARVHTLFELGHWAQVDADRKQRADEAAKRWREAGKRLKEHRRKRAGGGGYPTF